ncbi:MAG TPA: HigA family addiction module antitoxin [Hyphomicrobiaceae bacterium]|nr:HigA family addiction module antitoxin [Hyphomicrobiaceae bacterium]
MAMKSPAHPGRLLKEDIEALGLTVAEAAKCLGVTRQQLYRVLSGTSGLSPEMALRLEKAIGTSADTWLRMQMAFDLAQVRKRAATIEVKRLSKKVA